MHIATNILVVELIACDQALLHFESYNDDCGGGKGPGACMVACYVRVVFINAVHVSSSGGMR